jgi:hypothetical protein
MRNINCETSVGEERIYEVLKEENGWIRPNSTN